MNRAFSNIVVSSMLASDALFGVELVFNPGLPVVIRAYFIVLIVLASFIAGVAYRTK
jgi:hypothetical protein